MGLDNGRTYCSERGEGSALPMDGRQRMSIGKRGFLAMAPALIATAFLTATAPCGAGTQNAQERRDARDTRQDGRQDGRKEKVDCRQADQKSNSECRQEYREDKQDARQKARDIKY
jgi:hypothetical protein